MTTDICTHKFSDNYRFAKSKTILTPTADTFWLMKIPRYAFVTDVWLWVETAGDSDTVEIGWAGNSETAVTAGFLSVDIAKATVIGLKRAVHDTLTAFEGKYFDSASGLLTMTVGTAQGTGAFYVFAEYSIIH